MSYIHKKEIKDEKEEDPDNYVKETTNDMEIWINTFRFQCALSIKKDWFLALNVAQKCKNKMSLTNPGGKIKRKQFGKSFKRYCLKTRRAIFNHAVDLLLSKVFKQG